MNTLELSTTVGHDVARRAKGLLVLIGAALLIGLLFSAGAALAGKPAAAAFVPDPTCGASCGQIPPRPQGFLPHPTGPAWTPGPQGFLPHPNGPSWLPGPQGFLPDPTCSSGCGVVPPRVGFLPHPNGPQWTPGPQGFLPHPNGPQWTPGPQGFLTFPQGPPNMPG